MDLKLNLSQEQKLIMTQQMQLSIKLLQMSTYELKEYIEKEFSENPVLESQYNITSEEENNKHRLEYKEVLKYLEGDNYSSQSYSEYTNGNEISPFTFISQPITLQESLREQIIELPIESYLKSVCSYMIECLDNKGYLEIKLEEISKEINSDIKVVERALILLQNLEPAGIGARSIEECLILQLTRRGEDTKLLKEIIENCLIELADNKYQVIAKKLNISIKEAQYYGDIIKKLEPKPSRGFYTGEEVKFIIPDAEVRNIQGEYFIIMNDRILPKLTINPLYNDILNKDKDNEAIDYIKEKINSALFLIKSIDERKNTLYRVLEKIIEKQKAFFEKGERFLTPMTLKDIAEELNLHESTISRAIREKYILTSFGTVKIKELFTTGVQSVKGDITGSDFSVVSIKKSIENLIKEEDKSKPMSDQALCNVLIRDGIDISRRTVAKYREELGIKSSSKRKRF